MMSNWLKRLHKTQRRYQITKHSMRFLKYLLLTLFLSFPALSFSQTEEPAPTTRILFIYDASGSMLGNWESNTKMVVARRMLIGMVDSLRRMRLDNLQLALRVYGHNSPSPPQDCDDTRLEVPFAPNNYNQIINTMQVVRPKGTTPIARSLQYSEGDFPPCDNCRNVIILITDGIEECDGDPCAISRHLQENGVILRPFVIGVGLDEDFRATFECVGQYFDAAEEESFGRVLGVVIDQALHNTTAQINLIDDNGNASETDVPMALYDNITGRMVDPLVHTMNVKGNPDTLVLDPLVQYRLSVFTIPPVFLDSIDIITGTHNHVGLDAGQGELQLLVGGGRNINAPQAIIRRSGQMQTLNVQDFNTSEQYLTGLYDVEILTHPRIYQYGVEIEQSTTTRLAIPSPGFANFRTTVEGPGAIFVRNGDELEWVLNINPNMSRQTYSLQPGQYVIMFRPGPARSIYYTKSQNFRITSGNATEVNMR